MAAHHTQRTTVQTLISPTDLRACTGPAEVFELFRKLRYPVEPRPIAVPLEQGDLAETLRASVVARYPVARVPAARQGQLALDVTLFVLDDAGRKSALVRGIAAQWTRRYPGNHLLIFAVRTAEGGAGADGSGGGNGGFSQLTFVSPDRLGEGAQVRVKLRKLIVERSHPTRHDADTLNRIALAALDATADAAYKAQIEAFNVERMTETFYRGYSELFRRALARIKAENPAIQDFYDDSKLHAFTQRLFGRVMFLYFLQKKRALDGNLNFIAQQYDDAVRRHENFYRFVLEPLFFETLNQQREGARSAGFGRVPYLNGGLFAPDGLDHVGEVYLADELFDAKGEGGILYFLNNHNFTVEEDTPLEVEVALDPEMLGKVFENLLEAEERGQSGTFYTPRAVVAFMCREALAAYLERSVPGLDAERLGWLLDEAETGEPARDEHGRERLTYHNLSYSMHQRIEEALLGVRVLDPAVGSGAFPLGMLALLVGVRRALHRVRENEISPRARIVEDWKRAFIRDCLYGVDIKPEAIEIARLRLWLSLVVDADPFDMEPLPNLDYKLMAGDSLIETFDGVEIYPTRPRGDAAAPTQHTLITDSAVPALIHTLHERQAAYFQPDSAGKRDALKREIQQTEYDIVHETLRARHENENQKLKAVIQKLANLQGRAEPRELAAERQRIQHSIDVTESALADLKAGKPLPFFLYRLHFASVFAEKDGFDIVIANPPYVSILNMEPAYKDKLKEAYPEVAAGRADLYVYFYARALELLCEGGTVCYISSNKYFRAGYGKGLVNVLQKQSRLRIVIDFGDFPVFDAAAYPSILIADKGSPRTDHAYRAFTADESLDLDKLAMMLDTSAQNLLQSHGIRPPSASVDTPVLARALIGEGKPLGDFVGGRIYYGVKAGRPVFMIDQATHDKLVAEDSRSSEILRPFLRGRDIGRYLVTPSARYLIYTYRGIDIGRYPAVVNYLEPFRSDLEGRVTKQAWYELQQPQGAYRSAFEGPKIVYPDIAPHGEFAFDSSGSYLSNTTYFIPTREMWLCALLNSKVIEYVHVALLSPQLRGGYLRFFTQYVEQLPIVEPSAEDKRRLDELVDALQALGGQGPQAVALEHEVDAIVYRTYGLTAEEIAEIERWHAERRALLGKGRKRGNGHSEEDAE